MSSSKRTEKRTARKRTQSRRSAVAAPPTRTEQVMLGAVALFAVFRLAALIFTEPGTRVWGMDFPRYILSDGVIVVLLLPVLAAVPSIARRLARLFPGKPLDTKRVALWTLVAVSTGILLLLIDKFPVAYSFLGDGAYCHTEVFRVKTIPGHISPMFDKATAYGTGQLIRIIIKVFEFRDTRFPFTLLGFIGIVILVPGLFYLLRREPLPHALLIVFALLAGPSLLFFFGYVEMYTLQYVFLALFFAASYRAFVRNGSWIAPAVLLCVSIVLGISSIIFAPALLVLILHSLKTGASRLAIITLGICITLLAAFIAVVLFNGSNMSSTFLLPGVSGNVTEDSGAMTGWFGYSIFSLAHLADIVNILLLTAGPLLFAALAALLVHRNRSIVSSPLMLFSVVASLAGLCVLLGGNAFYGLARDWDLATIAAAGIVFFLACMLSEMAKQNAFRLGIVLPALILVFVSGSYTWVAVNASPASAKRLESIVDLDADYLLPRVTSYGYENIRKYHASTKNNEERLRIIKKMIPVGINTMDLIDRATSIAVNLENPEKRILEVRWCFDWMASRMGTTYEPNDYRYIAPRLLEEYVASGILRLYGRYPDLARELLAGIQAKHPAWKLYSFVDQATTNMNDISRISELVETSIPLDTQDGYLLLFGGNYMRLMHRYEMAAAYYETALKRNPHRDPIIYVALGKLYEEHIGNPAKAIATLERCLENCKLASERRTAIDLLTTYKRKYAGMQ